MNEPETYLNSLEYDKYYSYIKFLYLINYGKNQSKLY